jgi:hypothetical protein
MAIDIFFPNNYALHMESKDRTEKFILIFTANVDQISNIIGG